MLPRGVSAELNATFDRMRNVSNDGDLEEVVSNYLNKLNLELDTREPFYDLVRDVVDEPTVQRWLNIEEDKEILEVLVQDAAQAMQPVESDGEPLEEDQRDDDDMENETLKS